MADDQRIRVQRPDGRYSTIPLVSLKEAVARGYTYAPPAAGSKIAVEEDQPSFLPRALDRVSEAAEGTSQIVPQLLSRSREAFRKGRQEGGVTGAIHSATAPFQAESSAIGDLLKGVGGITTPGLIGRIAAKEDPARIFADMALAMLPGREGATGVGEALKPVYEKGFETPVRVVAQEMAGAGKEPVLQARIRYDQAVRDYAEATAEKKAEHAGKVAEARRAWVDKAMEARRAQQAAAANAAKRETLTRGQEAYTDRLRQNIAQTFQTVKSRLDGRWHGLRTTPMRRTGALTILKDEPLNSRAIADTVDVAEKKFLQGAPESVKQFRDLMHWMREDAAGGPEAMVDEAGGAAAKLRPITWDEARTHYSALGDRMFSGDLPGNVVQAIRYVRNEGLGAELKAGATRANALPAYESLLNDWSRFESDWKDMSSVTRGGGSPLAIAVKAPSAATLLPQVTGRTGDLLVERLGRYKDQGGSPSTAAAIRRMGQELESLPKLKSPAMPDRVKLPAEPKLGKPPEEPNPVAIRHGKLLERSARAPSWFDFLFPPAGVEHLALKSPWFREWVAHQEREETPLPLADTARTGMRRGPESESDVEMTRRRGPGTSPATKGPAALAMLRSQVDNLRMVFERQRTAGDPQMWATGSRLRDAMEQLKKAEREQWPEAYRGGPPAFSREGGGGANYTADELAEFKRKHGIP